MEAVDAHMLSEWLRAEACIPAARAAGIAEALVTDGWSSQKLLLAEWRATDGDKEAFLGKLPLRGDRRRLLVALEALEKRVEGAEGQLKAREATAAGAQLPKAEESEMLEWLLGLGIQRSHAEEYAPRLVAEGLDDASVLGAERRAAGEGFLAHFVPRRGDARRIIDALLQYDPREAEPPPLGETPGFQLEGQDRAAGKGQREIVVRVALDGTGAPTVDGAAISGRFAAKPDGPRAGDRPDPDRPPEDASEALLRVRRAARGPGPAATVRCARHMNAASAVQFLDEIAAVARRDLAARRRLGSAGACEAVARALREFPAQRAVQKAGCAAACALMTNCGDHQRTMADLGLRGAGVAIMSRWSQDALMQMAAQGLVAALEGRKAASRAVDTHRLPF